MLDQDENGHVYMRVENIRITYIPGPDRRPDANWAGSDVIRVQAHKNAVDNSLHMGAELPVPNPEIFAQFVAAICQVYVEGRA